MKRFIEQNLISWKQSELRKTLIVRGKRQVGKTFSILQFGKNHFKGNVHLIDLEKRMDLHSIFEKNLDVKRIVAELELVLNIGLMQFLNGIKIHEEFNKKDLLSIYNGALAEQFVGQELIACKKGELYFWARQAKSSTAEVDYLTVAHGEICPIEVKSGKPDD